MKTLSSLGIWATTAILLLGQSVQAEEKIPVECTAEGIKATGTTPDNGDCWESGVLKKTKACIDKIQKVEKALTWRGGEIYDGETALNVMCRLGPDGKLEHDFEQLSEAVTHGVLVAEEGSKIILATSIAEDSKGAPAKKLVCDWDGAGEPDEDYYVDIDLLTGSVRHGPKRMVVPQNQGLLVRVCHRPEDAVEVTWGGTRGLVPSKLKQAKDGEHQAEQADEPQPASISTLRFPPRIPGSADLTVSVKGADANKAKNSLKVELEVEELLWGAVRVGLGTSFDVGNRWRGYDIATFAGSRQPEIRETHNAVAFEVVNGFAPYLIDVLLWGGRSHTGGNNAYVSPYIGYGIVGASTSGGISALSSFHAGLEFEFASNFSLATTFTMRRTKTLADGYFPGSPVTAGMTVDGVSETSWQPGFGLVLSASPSFLQFAIPSSSSGGKTAPAQDATPSDKGDDVPAPKDDETSDEEVAEEQEELLPEVTATPPPPTPTPKPPPPKPAADKPKARDKKGGR